MKIYEVVICGDSYGYFKSFEKAKRVTKEILRDKIFVDGLEDDEKLYEEICNELDEQDYSMAVEVNIYESAVDMED